MAHGSHIEISRSAADRYRGSDGLQAQPHTAKAAFLCHVR